MSELIEVAFEQHYVRTASESDSWHRDFWERDGEPVVYAIMNAGDFPEDAARHIQQLLEDEHAEYGSDYIGEESEFDGQSYYEERGTSDEAWQEDWRSFEQGLKSQARFFSRQASAHLASIFHQIDQLQTTDGRALIVDAGPASSLTTLYRARAFQADDKLLEAMSRPDLHLGPPPSQLAAAGRMNARGISVFYGTNEARVAIAEVQPPVGSQVLVGQFEITRPLRLLDLTALSDVASGGSVFDPESSSRMERAMFLRSLSARISRPVMPDDEPFEYLATQAVADFLATESELELDGIIFPSVQVAGAVVNVALFHKAAGVEELELPHETKIEARRGRWEEDGFEIDYEVIERVPPPPEEEEPDAFAPLRSPIFARDWRGELYDVAGRDPTLRVALDSLRVHVIQKVEYDSTPYPITRRRRVDRNPKL
ncbi:hypothetical protein ASD21_12325 [Caulobacter sp. Root1455]|nr:hypothetical protein ASD21_12325 [Caulobacter sp. Root1455]